MTLYIYKDDFLKDDMNEAWIIRHREMLKKAFIKGVLMLANHPEDINSDRLEHYISKAVDRDPCNEALHAARICTYLREDQRPRAIQAFQEAERLLGENLHRPPGPQLSTLLREARRRN